MFGACPRNAWWCALAMAVFLVLAVLAGGGCSSSPEKPAVEAPVITAQPQSRTVPVAATATFSVTATGTAPLSYQWKKNGVDIAGATADSHTTPAATLADNGSQFTVLVSNSAGSVLSDAATLTVTPPPGVMLFTANWGDRSILITDDLLNVTGTATPRVIKGPTSTINYPLEDALALDRTRNFIYLVDGSTIKVWISARTVEGDIAPARVFNIAGASDLEGIAVDGPRDRLYVGAWLSGQGRKVLTCAGASLLNGTATAEDTADVEGCWLSLDTVNDRLYVTETSSDAVYVLDGASNMASHATPARTIHFTGLSLRKIWIDPAADRLYLASRNNSPGGNNIFAFAGASLLNGTIGDPDASSAARFPLSYALNVMVDSGDRLYCWKDSATEVYIYYGASALAGAITRNPDKTVPGVVKSGYGLDYLIY